jgi:hypothetical protein
VLRTISKHFVLRVIDGPAKGCRFTLPLHPPSLRYLLTRKTNVDDTGYTCLTLVGDNEVSSKHAELSVNVAGPHIDVRDLGSTNGFSIYPSDELWLERKGRVRVGNTWDVLSSTVWHGNVSSIGMSAIAVSLEPSTGLHGAGLAANGAGVSVGL